MKPDILVRRTFATVLIVFLDGLGFGIVIPLLPFLVLSLHGSPSSVTQLVGIYALASFFGGVIAGELSDRFGRVLLVRATLLGSVLAYLGMAFVAVMPALFLFRALSGLMTGRDSVIRTMATDDLPQERHVEKIGTLAAAYAVGAALGPGVASLVALLIGENGELFRAVFLMAVIATVATFCLVLWCWPTPDAPRRRTGSYNQPPGRYRALLQVRAPLAMASIGSYGFATVLSVTALFGHEAFGWGPVQTGWLLVGVSIAIAWTRMTLVPWCAKRWGIERCLVGCAIIGFAALVSTSFASIPLGFSAGICVISLTMTGITVLSNSIISIRAPIEYRGFLFGITQALWAGALFIGSTVNGLLFEYIGRGAPYKVAALLLLSVPLIAWPAFNRRPED